MNCRRCQKPERFQDSGSSKNTGTIDWDNFDNNKNKNNGNSQGNAGGSWKNTVKPAQYNANNTFIKTSQL
jgi:hypothetical protein